MQLVGAGDRTLLRPVCPRHRVDQRPARAGHELEHGDPAARPDHSRQLVDQSLLVCDILAEGLGPREVECLVSERQRQRVTADGPDLIGQPGAPREQL